MDTPMHETRPTTVLLVDDHPLMRNGLRAMLENEPDIDVVGEAADGEQALDQVRTLSPAVVVMDITMPKLNGIDATRRILDDAPDTKIVALSIHSEKRFVDGMLRAGATGYVLKDSAPEELVLAIHAVTGNEAFLSAPIQSAVVADYRSSDNKTATAAIRETTAAPTSPILLTKLHRPAIPPNLVLRNKLVERLEAERIHPLTLVSAPAGYGKSVLISSWLEHSAWPGAWLSLENDDIDLRQFLIYFVTAIHGLFPQACEDSLRLSEAPMLPPFPHLAAVLANELDAIEQSFILVLDDYHNISVMSPVNDLVRQLLARPPIPLHLVIISRRDPPLPLVMLRAKGQITDIRMQDLRFSKEETRSYLESTVRITADEALLAKLDSNIEGWAVGLQLLSLAARHSRDAVGFIEHLPAGSQQSQNYMVNEVAEKQPPELREWLLKSAILDCFCGPLCDAVCAGRDGAEALPMDGNRFISTLCEENIFVIELDTQGEWFRYHHLFQALLQRELSKRLVPGEIAEIHLHASAWFENRGMLDQAIRHALAADDPVRAAEIVEANRGEKFLAEQWVVVDRWLAMLPDELKRERPRLVLTEAWIRYLQFLLAQIPMLLDRAESLLRGQTAEPVVLAEIAFFRGFIAYFEGEAEQSVKYLEGAMSNLAGTKSPILGDTELMLGLARCMNGNQNLAVQALESRLGEIDSSESYVLCRLIAGLGYIHMLGGDLYQLRKEGQRLADVSKKHNMHLAEAWGYYFLAFGYLHAGKLEAALPHFVQVDELRYVMEPRAMIDALAGLALTQQLLQREVEAEKSIQRLQEFARELEGHSYLSLAQSCQTRLSLLRGNVNPAVDWSRSVEDPPVAAELFSWFEATSITQARVLIADGSEQSLLKAVKQIQSVRDLCEKNRFTCQTIEVTVLQSLLFEKQGHSDAALKSLEEAIVMAEPGGWVRPFIELGRPMAELLGRFVRQKGRTDYVHRILDAFQTIDRQPVSISPGSSRPGVAGAVWTGEPLTKRELEILGLVACRLQNKEIASRLFVSPETVKTHLKHLYQKLGVSNRRDAAAMASKILRTTRPAVQPDVHTDTQ
jgi:LuxR family maltose regulon positive regulatory protein